MNKQIKITSKAVASFMFFVLVIGLQEKILPAQERSDQKNLEATQIFEGFLGSMAEHMSSQRKVDGKIRLTEGVNRVSTVAGRTVEIGGPEYLGIVSATQKMVTYFLNRRGFPRSHPSVDRDGSVVEPSDIRDQMVKIDFIDANFTAMEICRLGVGDELFSDLCLTQGELAYRGSYFVYEFSWSECADDLGNARFLSRVSVTLNPENGHLISYSNQTSVPVADAKSFDSDRINSAVQKTVGDRPFVVTRKVPFRFWNEDGTSEDRCAVTFRLKRSPPDEVGSILISLKDYRVISTKSDATIAGIWDASGICP